MIAVKALKERKNILRLAPNLKEKVTLAEALELLGPNIIGEALWSKCGK
ncbi:hypothetical protein [Caldicoprobacter algeriensis]|nr:hypothetical protein [Caldicoprobacter algeriensis]